MFPDKSRLYETVVAVSLYGFFSVRIWSNSKFTRSNRSEIISELEIPSAGAIGTDDDAEDVAIGNDVAATMGLVVSVGFAEVVSVGFVEVVSVGLLVAVSVASTNPSKWFLSDS